MPKSPFLQKRPSVTAAGRGFPVVRYAFGSGLRGRTASFGSNYRYGMNTQEKETELGEGVTSAEYWFYNGKLGRRWNQDPRPFVSISNYACFSNNPLCLIDKFGDTIMITGSPDFRNKVFTSLQQLTNDKLQLLDNGIILIVIDKMNTMNLDKKLNTGTELIRTLNRKGSADAKLVIIRETYTGSITSGNDNNKRLCNKDNTSGIGTGSIINLDLNQKSQRMADGTMTKPPLFITLAHEMFHALHNWNGENVHDRGFTLKVYPENPVSDCHDGKKYNPHCIWWVNEEEILTRIQENSIRKEHKLIDRAEPIDGTKKLFRKLGVTEKEMIHPDKKIIPE